MKKKLFPRCDDLICFGAHLVCVILRGRQAKPNIFTHFTVKAEPVQLFSVLVLFKCNLVALFCITPVIQICIMWYNEIKIVQVLVPRKIVQA